MMQKNSRLVLFLFLISFFLYGCQTQTKLVNNVSERDANEIIVLLSRHGIIARKDPGTTGAVGGAAGAAQMWDISVPSSQVTEALSILNQAGLPRPKATSLLDLFGTSGLVPSDLQDRVKYQEGLSEQLASTIRKMDGILDADVQISFPRDEEEKKPLTASVYIKHQGILDNPNSLIVTKIKRLVASAVPGLTIENVSVVADKSLYTEQPLFQAQEDGGKEFVRIWSVHVAKDSTGRFRAIFYVFIFILFILGAALAWILWKFYPIIANRGMKVLVTTEQLKDFSEGEKSPPQSEEEPRE